MRRIKAFTLVELLVVVGIIAVLIAVLLPVLGKVRAQALAVACACNQHQIALGCLSYACENRGVLPIPCDGYETPDPGANDGVQPFQAIYLVTFGQADWNRGTLWPYVPGGPEVHRRLFNCPAEPTQRPTVDGAGTVTAHSNFGYTFNRYMLGVSMNGSLRYGVRLVQVHHPDHKIMLMELEPSTLIEGDPVVPDPPRPFLPLMTTRHSHGANTCFVDGHVEWMDPSTFVGSYPPGASVTLVETYRHYIMFSRDD